MASKYLTMHVNVAQNSNFSKTGSYFSEEISSGFPSHVLQLLCLSAAFDLAELSQQLPAAAASVCRQPTCSSQEPPWITELRQSSRTTSEGKPDDIFSKKIWPSFCKFAVLCSVLSYIVLFFEASGRGQRYILLKYFCSSRLCWVRAQCLFLLPCLSEHTVTGCRGDTRTQTKEEKTVREDSSV